MTREEAIDLLDNLIGMIEDNHNSDYDTAFKMAIKALEQGDILQEIWNKTYRLHPINRGDNDYANGVYDGMCRVIDIICNTIDSKIKELSE